VRHEKHAGSTLARGYVRTLRQQEELPLLRDHLLRLDRESRHDRFHGFMMTISSNVMPPNALTTATVIIAYIENGVRPRRGGAPSARSVPGFAAGDRVQRRGMRATPGGRQRPVQKADRRSALGGLPLLADHHRRAEPGDAGARQQVRCASDIPPRRVHRKHRSEAASAARTCKICDRNAGRKPHARSLGSNRAYWKLFLRMYGWGRTA